MSHNTPDLLPCPCGKPMQVQRDESSDYSSRWYWTGQCTDPDCGWMFSGLPSKEETVALINRRPLPPGEGKEGAGSEASPDASRREIIKRLRDLHVALCLKHCTHRPKLHIDGCGSLSEDINAIEEAFRAAEISPSSSQPAADVIGDARNIFIEGFVAGWGDNINMDVMILAMKAWDSSESRPQVAAGISPSSSNPQAPAEDPEKMIAKWYCVNCKTHTVSTMEGGDLVCACGHIIASYKLLKSHVRASLAPSPESLGGSNG